MTNRSLRALIVAASMLLVGVVAQAQDARTSINASALPARDKTAVVALLDRAAALGVPADDLDIITSRALNRGADREALSGMLRTVITAAERELPLRPIVDRLEQGLAKNISFPRIDAATEGLTRALEEGKKIVDGLARPAGGRKQDHDAAIEAAARALEQSVPADRLRATGASALAGSGGLSLVAASFSAIGALATNGVMPDQADRIIRKALGAGYSEQGLAGLERQLLADLKAGKPVAAAADELESKLERRPDRAGDGGRERRGSGGDRGFGGGGGGRR